MDTQELIDLSFNDISDDLAELTYLTSDLKNKLVKTIKEIKNKKTDIQPDVYIQTIDLIDHLIKTINPILNNLAIYANMAKSSAHTQNYLNDLIKQKSSFYNQVRNLAGITASITLSTDWQSPTFNFSLFSMAGRQTGNIVHSLNDYKRDQHHESHYYERKFISEYVENPLKITVGCFATSSGMSAFTTIINYLVMNKKIKYVVAGKCTYFESLLMLKGIFKDKLILVDETDTKSIISAIRSYEPEAVFFDTICNSEKIPVTDIEKIIIELNTNSRNNPYLIIDNTVTSIKFQPIKKILLSQKLNYFLFESLNKYHQFGMDRVTGGIIYFKCKSFENIIEFRDHLGTIIPDQNTIALPSPNRYYLKKRLERLSRNTQTMAELLDNKLSGKSKRIRSIIYPGLPSHPCYQNIRQFGFSGPFLNLDIFERYMTIAACKNMIKKAINIARKNNLQIVEGTSFGLPNTRLYLTDVRSLEGNLFFRISPGTETISEIHQIAGVLYQSFI
jgi:cystathionine beta-lyase/cystathionine gamma-synthase